LPPMRYTCCRGHSVLPPLRRDDSGEHPFQLPVHHSGLGEFAPRRSALSSRLRPNHRPERVAISSCPPTHKGSALPELQQRDISGVRRLPGMRGPGSSRRRGRRGRRTAAMIRAAQERIQDLFSLAELEARRAPPNLSQRYVVLARRVGMRYNVRLLREYRDVYCRGCSMFWVEGLSVRTRLRSGRRSQTCLGCGRIRRTVFKHHRPASSSTEGAADRAVRREQAVLIGEGLGADSESELDEGEDP
jgi:ribonuclease P protein subunit RPR2